MKIALVGYGKMGRKIEDLASLQGHLVVAKVTSSDWNDQAIEDADVCIEFSTPDSAIQNIRRIIEKNKPIVIGTTGWYDHLESIRLLVEESGAGAVYASNFSLGMNVFTELIKAATALFCPFTEYDVAGIEYHHKEKKDAPSGTAKELAQMIKQRMFLPDDFAFSSVRCGSFPGIHTVLFDSSVDSVSLTHEAKNRDGFALGAIRAAEWIVDKKGFFPFSFCVQDLIRNNYEK